MSYDKFLQYLLLLDLISLISRSLLQSLSTDLDLERDDLDDPLEEQEDILDDLDLQWLEELYHEKSSLLSFRPGPTQTELYMQPQKRLEI